MVIFLFFVCICIKQFYQRRRSQRPPNITIHATGVFSITNNASPPPQYDDLEFTTTTSGYMSSHTISSLGGLENGRSFEEPPPPDYESLFQNRPPNVQRKQLRN